MVSKKGMILAVPAVFLLMVSPLSAQQTGDQSVPDESIQLAEPAAQSPFPYVGRIMGTKVYIRSGPAEVYYPVGQLDEGQLVVVLEEKYGSWARVEPTGPCFSYISCAFVKLVEVVKTPAQPTGDISDAEKVDTGTQEQQQAATEAELTALVGKETIKGQVIGNRVRVRAGSVDIVPPANATEVQMKLNVGDEVEVIGQRDNFYKIKCPEGCFFWVSLDYIEGVAPATDEAISKVQQQETTAVEQQKTAAQQLEQMSQDRQEYLAAVEMLKAEQAKPMDQRDYQPVRERLEKLLNTTESVAVKSTGQILEQHLTRCETGLNLWKLSHQQDQQLKDTLTKIDQDKQKVELLVAANFPAGKSPDGIVVKGLLEKSAVFTEENKNQRFLVLDDENRIIYYAVSGATGLDLSQYVGKNVSMMGSAQYDTLTRIRVLRVTRIVEVPPGIKRDKKADEKVIKNA